MTLQLLIDMTELWPIKMPRGKPDATFEITGADNRTIPVEVYFKSPFELATRFFIIQFIDGDKHPNIDILFIDRPAYTGEYVVTDIGCDVLFVAKDKEHFMYILRERVLPHYDGDLVKKIEVIIG
jgi:hypothetical protein